MTKSPVPRLIIGILLAMDFVLLGMFLAGFFARFVPPNFLWWFQLAGIALPYISLLLVIATFIVIRQRAWRLAVFHAVCLALAAIRFIPFGAAPASAPTQLNYVTYNIGHPEKTDAASRTEQMAMLLETTGADIIGFQEFVVRYRPREPQLRNIPMVSALFDSLGYSAIAEEENEVGTSFLPVVANEASIQLLRQEKRRLYLNDQPEFAVHRVEFAWEGREAVLYNVHLRTFGEDKLWDEGERGLLSWSVWKRYLRQYRDAFRMRAWEAGEVQKLIEEEKRPVILSGDFNSTQHNYAYNLLATELQDGYRAAGGIWGATYPARFPLVRIDHVLLSPEWQVNGAEVINLKTSDHRPTRVSLSWKE